MGLLNNVVDQGLQSVGLGGVTKRQVRRPLYIGGDFPEGLRIVELIDDREQMADEIVLAGVFAPHQPFEFGGEQRLVREDYAGSSEPTVQVLGPKEDNTPIRGTLKSKFFKDDDQHSLRLAAAEYQELIDAMRIRGNLVKITLGEWRRYGFIEKCKFKMRTTTDIDYEIEFMVVGFNPPSNCRFVDRANDDLTAPNKEITSAAAAALDSARTYPDEMPRTISDFLTDQISAVASAISVVTGFVDGILSDVEQVTASANRAVGLIKYARATISRTVRRVGAITTTVEGLGSSFASEAQKAAATVKNINHINRTQRDFSNLSALLSSLQARFASIASSIPQFRHLVVEGDSLQKIAIKYYNNADNWKRIYDHNKLRSTELQIGAILEIPRL